MDILEGSIGKKKKKKSIKLAENNLGLKAGMHHEQNIYF